MQKDELRQLIIGAFATGVLVGIAIIMAVLMFVRNVVDAQAAEAEPQYIEITEGPESADREYLGEFRLTFYCPGRCCNGKNAGIDCYGDPLVWGTVAVDPKVIPLKSHLIIDGFDMTFAARDVGNDWVQGKQVDIFVPTTHKEAAKMNDKYTRAKVWRVK